MSGGFHFSARRLPGGRISGHVLPVKRTPALNLAPAIWWLAIVFAAIHVGRQLLPPSTDDWVLLAFSFIPARYETGGEFLPGGASARLWSPLTYAFLHADFVHLGVNVAWMVAFGSAVARRFGTARFLVLSACSAVAGIALHYAFHSDDQGLVVGASGAVSGMMAAAIRFAFSPGGPLAGGRGPPASYVPAQGLGRIVRNPRTVMFILVWFVVNLFFGMAGDLIPGVSGPIAWEAHIGGFAAGLLLFPLFDPARPPGHEGLAS